MNGGHKGGGTRRANPCIGGESSKLRDDDYLPRPKGLQRSQDRIDQGQQVLDLIGRGTDHDNGELTARRMLLMRYALIDGQEDVVARHLGSRQQLAIFPAFESRPLDCVHIVPSKVVAEVER